MSLGTILRAKQRLQLPSGSFLLEILVLYTDIFKYQASKTMCHKNYGSLSPLAHLCLGIREVQGVVPNAILHGHSPEMSNICTVSECHDASSRNIDFEKGCWPEYLGSFVRPYRPAIAGEAVDKHNT